MTDRDLLIKGRKCGGKCSRCVSVDEDNVWMDGFEDFFHAVQDRGCDIVKGLFVLHDGKVVVGGDVESLQYLVQHGSVLAGDGYDCMERRAGLKFLYERAHFNGFGAGAEDYEDCFLVGRLKRHFSAPFLYILTI